MEELPAMNDDRRSLVVWGEKIQAHREMWTREEGTSGLRMRESW